MDVFILPLKWGGKGGGEVGSVLVEYGAQLGRAGLAVQRVQLDDARAHRGGVVR